MKKIKTILRFIWKKIPYLLLPGLIGLVYLYYNVTSVEKEEAGNPTTIRNVTGLYSVENVNVITPQTTEEIISLVKNHKGQISVGGGRFSMGGQTASEKVLQLDMRNFNKVLNFSKEKKEITVQSGITWRKIQEHIDPHNLSVKIMQTYANFTVGGSLSVNVHGRYIGLGPVIFSVKSFKMVLPNGDLVTASPEENSELFYGAIGGYGALGVIVEVTLSLADNEKVERINEVMTLADYKNFFVQKVRDDSTVVFHNANIYPNEYTKVRAVSYVKTDKPLTIEDRLQPADKSYRPERFAMWLVSSMPGGKWFREYCLDPYVFSGEEVSWRNHEASYNVKELEPASRKNSTYVLQEYFVPVDSINSFVPVMGEILNRHEVNVINISIRHAKKDPGSLLAWAKTEVFAFVLYYKQGTSEPEKKAVAVWTRELVEAAIKKGGAYYLPYQIHATGKQFSAAYPNADLFFALKRKVDPTNKFRNKLWDAYYAPTVDTILAKDTATNPSRFKSILSDIGKSDSLYLFLQNVYGLYPNDQFHYLIKKSTEENNTDEAIYKAIQAGIPEVKPSLWAFRYALPALKTQKKEIARQTAELVQSKETINGYLEIGTTGRYVNSLSDHFPIEGPVYLICDDEPSYSAQEIMERGQLSKIGTFYDIQKYAPITAAQIPDTSLDLVTIYIGLHHCPSQNLDGFVRSVARVLRPGGKLVIRDHNVENVAFGKFVSVIHDVFYSGLGKTWDYTSNEVRNYWSSDSLTHYLEARGFKGDGRKLLQANDPSKNTLMIFTKEKNMTTATNTTSEEPVPGYKRDEAQTYLTLPEWFLVYSPDEYAQFIKAERPSKFPYFGSSIQFWQYYRDIYKITRKKNYGFNGGYHLMVFVIGSSYSLENFVKGIYEATMGRLSEWFRSAPTEEDQYAARVAQEYVDFIRVDPWYEFDFWTKFKQLWKIDLFGKNLFRKWERKIILSNEYILKSVYAYLIKLGTKEVYGDAEAEIFAKVSSISVSPLLKNHNIKIVKTLEDSSLLISLPRYEQFREAVIYLSVSGTKFYEIAGNDEILATLVVPSEWKYDLKGELCIERPILTVPTQKRIGVTIPINTLHEVLNELQARKMPVEHIYDF